ILLLRRCGLYPPPAQANRRYESFRTVTTRAGFYFFEDVQRSATASSTATPESLRALLALDFRQTVSDRRQSLRALYRLHASSKSQPARPLPRSGRIFLPPV